MATHAPITGAQTRASSNIIPFPNPERLASSARLAEARENISSLEIRQRFITNALNWWRNELDRLQAEAV